MFGNLQQMVQQSAGAERFARVSNALFYSTPRINGFLGRVVYSLGSESAGGTGALPKDANTFLGLGANYTAGGLSLNASYQELKYPTVAGGAFTGQTKTRSDTLVGGTYKFGDFAVATGYWKMGAPQHASNMWLGASMQIGLGNLAAQVQRMQQDVTGGTDRKGTVLAVAYTYQMSKRTAMYASYGKVNNNSTSQYGIVAADLAVGAAKAGADPTAFGIGMRHNF